MMANLGKLERVPIREAWAGEASDFTPWLCKEENLQLLSETMQIDLEVVDREVSIGGYRLDILARRSDTQERVVIENQFGQTDHTHLGQLMTYAAGAGADGSGAKTVVWIAERFSDPHRSALDWLNTCTEPGIRFFGIELELWRIGLSAPAPRFNLISKPNDWQKTVTQLASAPTATDELYLDFWLDFIKFCETTDTTLKLPNAWARHWLPTFTGRVGFGINLTASRKLQKMECQLWIDSKQAKTAFALLLEEEELITASLGSQIEFDEMLGRKSCKIYEVTSGDIEDRSQWPNLHAWLKSRGEAYAKTFIPLIRSLSLPNV